MSFVNAIGIKSYKPPIFILGNRRSGTTLLRLMLTSHPHIAIPPEGGFIIRLGWKYDRIHFTSRNQIDRFLVDLYKSENIQDWEINKDDLRERLLMRIPCSFPVLIEEIYRAYNNQKFSSVKRRWGDKTTWYLNYLSQIQDYYPEAHYIHIIRDSRAVAASYKGVQHLPDDVLESTLDWLWSTRTISRFGKKIGQQYFYEIRYEDLVTEPERELKRICAFIKEPFEEEMLSYWKQNREMQLEPERHMDWKKLTLREVTNERIFRWKTILTDPEIRKIESLSSHSLEEHGYQLQMDHGGLFDQFRYSVRKSSDTLFRSAKRTLREKVYRLKYLLGLDNAGYE